MSVQEDRLLTMLSVALEMETQGKDYYEKAAARAKNELGQKIFLMLRDDELVHLERIRKIYDALCEKHVWCDEFNSLPLPNPDLGRSFNELALKFGPRFIAKSDDLKALEVGIEAEAKSIIFYQDQLKKAIETSEKEFLTRMVGEEKGHHAALSDMKLYLSDPSSWFREREKGGLDGA